MATVINNPSGSGESSGAGLIIGVVVAILIIVLFFLYGLPAIRGNNAPPNNGGSLNVDVDLPSGGAAASGGGVTY